MYLYAVSKHVVIVDCRPGCGRMAANGKLDVGGRGRDGGSEMWGVYSNEREACSAAAAASAPFTAKVKLFYLPLSC